MTPTLAVDIGGSKILAALVVENSVIERRQTSTLHEDGADVWIAQIAELARPWCGHFSHLGVTVTGIIENGRWSALNPVTLPVPDDYPIAERLFECLGTKPRLANDAQSAAWGEYRFGAGEGLDIVFLTISTGIGGGIVLNGRLVGGRLGLAGHFGQLIEKQSDGKCGRRFEDQASGRWMAEEARRLGYQKDGSEIFVEAGSWLCVGASNC